MLVASGHSNRWNKKGQNVIYTGSSRSLSTLELVVHRNAIAPLLTYKVMVISIADDDHLFTHIKTDELPINWRELTCYSKLQEIGSNWYNKNSSLILKVPSAVIPYESNYVINTENSNFKNNVKLIRNENYFWDDRLL